jgi:hypothetical protein
VDPVTSGRVESRAVRRLLELLARIRDRAISALDRRLGFWGGTVALGLLLPAPLAIVAVAARIHARRRAPAVREAPAFTA